MRAKASAAGDAMVLRHTFIRREVDVVFVHTNGEHLAARMAASGLRFSTHADRDAADASGYRVPTAVAPPGIDPAVHDATRVLARSELGVRADDRLIVYLHDGVAFRVPVISERNPLTEHYIADGIAGVLLGPGEPQSAAAAVAAFLAKDEQRIAMGNAGRARLQREFTLEPMIRGFEEAAAAGRTLAAPAVG